MQYVTIKQENKDGKDFFIVNAIPLKNTKNSVVQRIPHPLGSDILEYESLEDAKDAISRAGFSYILPNGKKSGVNKAVAPQKASHTDYDRLVLNAIKDKVNSSNSAVSAAAILAISEFACDEVYEILFSKLGEDNDLIRKNAISGICRYGNILQNRIIEALKSSNWVVRNSALNCIATLANSGTCDVEAYILPLTETCNDPNSIVQTSALTTLAQVYKVYQKTKRA